ncbi:MAG: M23 family metallopeptidase [Bacilli bacterium]
MSKTEFILKKIKEKNKPNISKSFLHKLLSKTLITIIILLGAAIFTKTSPHNKMLLYKTVYDDNISFGSVNKTLKKYLGSIIPFDNLDTESVFKDELTYKNINKYKDGVVLEVEDKYLVPIQESGVVVFIGEKNDYKDLVIIQQINGIDMWYSNVASLNIKIYDYVEKGMLLGETTNNKLYLLYQKDGKFLDYKDYIK